MTLFVGAGISLGSGLPSGSALGLRALELVVNRETTVLNHAELTRVRKGVKDLRLEILLERLGTEIPKALLFEVFELLINASPNINHLLATRLRPTAILTTNQDILLEESAKLLSLDSSIIHLHGRCDNKNSIVTMISQYLAGVRFSVATEFRKAILGSNVVVLGYSGRDSDVMSIFAEARMKTLTWIQHPGSSSSPELIRLKEQLGQRLQLVKADAKRWLSTRVSNTLLAKLKELARQKLAVIPRGASLQESQLQKLSSLDSNLAIGRVIEHLGWYDLGLKLYLRLLRQSHTESTDREQQTRVHLAIGRVHTYQYRFESASRRYLKIAHDDTVKLGQRCQAFVDCVFALRNSSRFTKGLRILTEFEVLLSTAPKTQVFNKFRGHALAARAGMLRIEGQALESAQLYKKANRCFRQAREVDGWLDVTTWLGDDLIMLGRFKEAADYLKQAVDESEAYGRYFSRAWSLYLRGEVLGFSGDLTGGLGLIGQANRIFESVNNPQGRVYCWLHFSDIVRERSLDEAEDALRRAQRLLGKNKFAYADARFLLEAAELARARHREEEMHEHLAILEDQLSNKRRFPRPPALFAAHAQSIKAEYAREKDHGDKSVLLKQARKAYNEIHAKHCVTRIDVSHWLTLRSPAMRSRLTDICRKQGYGLELNRLLRPSQGYYGLHFS